MRGTYINILPPLPLVWHPPPLPYLVRPSPREPESAREHVAWRAFQKRPEAVWNVVGFVDKTFFFSLKSLLHGVTRERGWGRGEMGEGGG